MRFIKAVKIFDGQAFLPGHAVLVFEDDGTLRETTSATEVPADKVEALEGTLCPGFINAHCHLELSHLRGQIARQTGFCDFAIELMSKRGGGLSAGIGQAMTEAEDEMIRNGIVAVGDISNTAQSFQAKSGGRMFYHTFVELIALNPLKAEAVFGAGLQLLASLRSEGLAGSLAAHAPYSVSAQLMGLITAFDRGENCPFTIHNQESIEETLFFMGKQSKVNDLYHHLNIDISWFNAPGVSSLAWYRDYLAGLRTILVHNTFTTAADIKSVSAGETFWCLCPGANLFIEGRLPDLSLFSGHAEQLCIGTDSLASNGSLDVVAELNLVAEGNPLFTEEQLLAMICSNGARALGVGDKYGSLLPGKKTGLNLLARPGIKFELLKKIF